MPTDEMFVGDIGTEIHVIVEDNGAPVDISSASPKQIIIRKPDGTKLTKNGVFETDGTDGDMYYKTVAGDVNIAGMWERQAYVKLGSDEYYSSVIRWPCHEAL